MSDLQFGDAIDALNLSEAQAACLACISANETAVQSLFEKKGSDAAVDHTLFELFSFQRSRGQTALFLVSHGLGWDAEIVLRSFYEAHAKIWFICYRDDESRKAIVAEFWGDLSRIYANHSRSVSAGARNLAREQNRSKVEQAIFDMLEDEQVMNFSELNKSDRRKLSNRWTFSQIIKHLHEDAPADAHTIGIKVFAHMYGIQSHLSHADSAGLNLLEDHRTRDDDEQRLKTAAHACRIYSDVASMWLFSKEALRYRFALEVDANCETWLKWKELHRHTQCSTEAFYASQEEFYSRYSYDVGDAQS